MNVDHALQGHTDRYAQPPTCVVRAPGRVNLIGDHTDYNGGLVLPFAIDQAAYVTAHAEKDDQVVVWSDAYAEQVAIPLEPGDDAGYSGWARFPLGVVRLLKTAGVPVPGCRLWVGSAVPVGSGLSSSAALEMSLILALLHLSEQRWAKLDVARLGRRVEHEYVGSPCGLMDQLCSMSGREGHAVLIDCAKDHVSHVPLHLDTAILMVVHTGVRHSIAGGAYARRRQECEQALAVAQRSDASIETLSGLTPATISQWAELEPVLAARALHVVAENDRVRGAVEALQGGDLPRLGEIMFASHESLRDQFEVSCEELDTVVEVARESTGVYGARMTGGGFGGCAVVLLRAEAFAGFQERLRQAYRSRYTHTLEMFQVRPADGAGIVWTA